MGTGHVMRCLVLVGELRADSAAMGFICAPGAGAISWGLLARHGLEAEEIAGAVDVVIGPSERDRVHVKSAARRVGAVTLHEFPVDFAKCMTQAYLVIGAFGVPTWERRYLACRWSWWH